MTLRKILPSKGVYFLGILILISLWGTRVYSHETEAIYNYSKVFIPLYNGNNQLKIAIRSYDKGLTPHFVLVDPYTLKTQVAIATDLKYRNFDHNSVNMTALRKTPYLQALDHYTSPPYRLRNYGATKAEYKAKGIFLTVDMCPCPSRRSFEKQFFQRLINLYKKDQSAVPIALCVSGLWMIRHKDEFTWLKEQYLSGKLDITWVNHSFSHPYYTDVPIERNFLLMRGDNFEQEVLNTEKILLENKLVPSPFFRFPGLIANETLIKKLKNMSLIPLGSSAWIAKGESIFAGSFILVHGNGNEPKGVKIIIPLLNQLSLRPIQQAFMPGE